MVLALPDQWIWDSWYAHDGDRWHAWFLKADKSLINPELRHFNVSQGHAVSDDLVNWNHLGTCLAPSYGPAWDDFTTWTGSVVQDDDGLWHLFYTGSRKSEEGLYQRVGHATASDMHSWERVGDGLCLDLTGPNARHYEADHAKGFWHDRAMRDPWVMRDPSGEGWLMYFTARGADVAEPNAGGAIGFATSSDLYTWELQPTVFVGGYGQLEVPQVFQAGGRWYCLFCTAAEHFSRAQALGTPGGPVTGNHYLVAEDPRGPWSIAPGFLDGSNPCRRYAARILEHEGRFWIMGFADRGPDDHFIGHVMDPEPVEIDTAGILRVRPQDKAAE
ncbi:MAG: levansucrase [Alphaproteobacteria bacterium]|jgi:beta-fructofuranosidase|nr:levansucrase [Alphaproteobacteria bacterium]